MGLCAKGRVAAVFDGKKPSSTLKKYPFAGRAGRPKEAPIKVSKFPGRREIFGGFQSVMLPQPSCIRRVSESFLETS